MDATTELFSLSDRRDALFREHETVPAAVLLPIAKWELELYEQETAARTRCAVVGSGCSPARSRTAAPDWPNPSPSSSPWRRQRRSSSDDDP